MDDTQTRDIDVGELLENRRLGPYHGFAFALCFLILFVDGLDYSAANVGAPAILRAFNAERAAMGTVFGWGYFGIFFGSVVFGISATDPVSFAQALALVLGIVLVATLVPAWRAARTNPLAALRHQ